MTDDYQPPAIARCDGPTPIPIGPDRVVWQRCYLAAGHEGDCEPRA